MQVLSGIRTVASLNAEKQELARYNKHLDGAYKAGIKEGMAKGVGNGMLFTSMYMSYALAFWFGTKQVRHSTVRYASPPASPPELRTASCRVLNLSSALSSVAPAPVLPPMISRPCLLLTCIATCIVYAPQFLLCLAVLCPPSPLAPFASRILRASPHLRVPEALLAICPRCLSSHGVMRPLLMPRLRTAASSPAATSSPPSSRC